LVAIGERTRAVSTLEHAASLEPESATIAANLGQLLVLQGNMGQAEVFLRRALALQPGHIEASHQLGVLLAQRGAVAEGLELLAQRKDLATSTSVQRIASVSYRYWQRLRRDH